MVPSQRTWLSVVMTLAINCVCNATMHAAERPNVVFLLADDLGWSDTTLYNTTRLYRTPNIQRLAERGMLFSRAYTTSPLCSPTRASILTGLSPARTGITTPACHLPQVVLQASAGDRAAPALKSIQPVTATRLTTDHYTLSEALQDAGYATAHFGKWHLGHEPYSPLQHGFDVDVPHWAGPGPAGSYVAPWKFPDFDPDTPDQHIEDRMAQEAVSFMEQHRDEPFFLNYWMFSVHAPFDAKASLIEQYRSRIDADDPQHSPTYAAMVHSMDDAVGTLLDTLDRLQIADRTIIVFTSDNGGNMYSQVDETTPTSNRPLRGGKATMYEGGVRVPAVVVWPGNVNAGSHSDQVIHSCDFYPTLLELLKLRPQPNQLFDGMSLVPALHGEELKRETVFCYFPHNPAVPDWLPPSVSAVSADWKLLRIFYGGEAGQHRWKLFHLKDDIGEQHDVAADFPERVRQMDALIEQFLIDTRAVVPLPNPSFDVEQYHPENEGVAVLKGSKATPATGNSAAAARMNAAVAGWRPGRDCRLTVDDGRLTVDSSGTDPYITTTLSEALPAGTYQMHVTLSSNGRGNGQFFWQQQNVRPVFHRDRSVSIPLVHDAADHEYSVEFTAAGAIPSVRLDPGQSKGKISVSAIRLTNADGEIVEEWTFRKPQ